MRKKVGADKVLIPSTAVAIINKNNEVLLHLRDSSKTWGLPGGIMDLGETASESASREVSEETGLIVSDLKIFGVFSGPNYEATYPNGDQTASVAIGFYTNKFSGDIRKSFESPEINFFQLNQLPKNINPVQTGFLRGFKAFINNGMNTPISS